MYPNQSLHFIGRFQRDLQPRNGCLVDQFSGILNESQRKEDASKVEKSLTPLVL